MFALSLSACEKRPVDAAPNGSGAYWETIGDPVIETYRIHGVDDDNVFVLRRTQGVSRFDGGNYQRVPVTAPFEYDLHCITSDNILVTAESGLYEYDGITTRELYEHPTRLYQLDLSNDGTIFCRWTDGVVTVGDTVRVDTLTSVTDEYRYAISLHALNDGQALVGTTDGLFVIDQGGFTRIETPDDIRMVRGFAGDTLDNLWIWKSTGVYHLQDGVWESFQVPAGWHADWVSLDTATQTHIVFSETNAIVLRGGQWEVLPLASAMSVEDSWISPSGQLYVVTNLDGLLRYDGTKWAVLRSPEPDRFYDAIVDDNETIWGDRYGGLFYRRGNDFGEIPPPTGLGSIRQFDVSRSRTVFATYTAYPFAFGGGSDRLLRKFDGQPWQQVMPLTNSYSSRFVVASDESLWMAKDGREIGVLKGEIWFPLRELPTNPNFVRQGPNDEVVWALARELTFLANDVWVTVELDFTPRDIVVNSYNDMVVASDVQLYRYLHGEIQPMRTQYNSAAFDATTILTLAGNKESLLLLAHDRTVLQFENQMWRKVAVAPSLGDLVVSPAGVVYMFYADTATLKR